jgi:parvulin-like peptidyl-prolyl isomerase
MDTSKFLSLLFLVFIILACTESQHDENNVIATIGDRNITQDEFRMFYELDPNFGIDSSGINALRDEVVFYLNQIKAYRKAQSDNLTSDPIFKRAVNWEKRQAMLRQLFREKILDRISVSEKELTDFFKRGKTKVHVRHLFVKDAEQIAQIQMRLGNGESFEKIAADMYTDSLLAANGGDLGWIELSELDENFARNIENLNVHQVSKPFRTQWGYHIAQVLDRKDQLLLNESEFESKKSSIRKKLVQMKSQKLSRQFVSSYMSDINPQPVKKTFSFLWQAIVPNIEKESSNLSVRQMLSNTLITDAREKLVSDLTQALISFKGGEVSLGEFLDAMEEIPVSQRPRFKSQQELSQQIAVWIRDEMLFKEARGSSLDDHPKVKEEVRRFAEEQSYYYYLNQINDTLSVPEKVNQYYNNNLNESNKLTEDLMKFHTLQEWKWNQARIRLWKILHKDDIQTTITERLLQNENNSIDWANRIRMFMVRKPE